MAKKYKYLFISLLLFFLDASICFASEGLDLGKFIKENIIDLLIGMGAGLAVLSLTIAGIQLMTSLGSSTAISNAKDRAIKSILGLILLLSCWTVLQTININLGSSTVFTVPTLPSLCGGGVFIEGTTLTYKCCPKGGGTAGGGGATGDWGDSAGEEATGGEGTEEEPIIWLRVWKNPNREPWSDHTVQEIKCNGTGDISGGSYSWEYRSPGLYLFTPGLYLFNGECSEGSGGSRSTAIKTNQARMNEDYLKKTNDALIINAPNTSYSAIFYSEQKYQGQCALSGAFLARKGENMCAGNKKIAPSASSFRFFQWNYDDWITSGDGVVFYSKHFGWQTGTKAGFYELKPGDITSIQRIELDEKDSDGKKPLTFSYEGIDIPKEEQNLCKTFKDCPGSIRIKGAYMVTLFAKDKMGVTYCETFTRDTGNLETSWILNKQGGRVLVGIDIIPYK